MPVGLSIVTPPAEEPVTLAQVKAQTRVETTADDALIAVYISAARELCEEISRRAFVTQTLRMTLDEWPCDRVLNLLRPPLVSVTSVQYIDYTGATYAYAPSQYGVDTNGEPGRIMLRAHSIWPLVVLQPAAGIVVTYVAGYGAATAVPKKYQMAVLLLAAHLYERREASTDISLSEIPFGVTALLSGDKGWY